MKKIDINRVETKLFIEKLREMEKVDIRTVDKSTLVDRSCVKLDKNMSREERILSYVEQIKNPYCYLDNGVVVKISFIDTDITLEDRLEEYVRNL